MDQLNNYLLHTYNNNYITGIQDCNLLVWGAAGAAEHTPKFCSLIVGFEYDPHAITQTQAENFILSLKSRTIVYDKLYAYGLKFAESIGIPFVIIVYPCLRNEYENNWEESKQRYPEANVMFYYKNITAGRSSVFRGAELRSQIYGDLQVSYRDEGTTKDKNQRIADYFHLWSRDYLSKSLTKFDLDGFIFGNEKSALIEFKRSNIPHIPLWYPIYDRPDYKLQLLFARSIGADFWLLHHEDEECRPDTNISFFKIENVTDEDQYFLKNSFRAMSLALQGDNSLDAIIRNFIQHGETGRRNDWNNSVYCPLCGAEIRNGMYGKYCPGKCGMKFNKFYGTDLSDRNILDLINGNPIAFTDSSGNEVMIYPNLRRHTYQGRTYYNWYYN